MKFEEIGLIFVVLSFFLMILGVDWLVRVVGERLQLFMRFYMCEGKV